MSFRHIAGHVLQEVSLFAASLLHELYYIVYYIKSADTSLAFFIYTKCVKGENELVVREQIVFGFQSFLFARYISTALKRILEA